MPLQAPDNITGCGIKGPLDHTKFPQLLAIGLRAAIPPTTELIPASVQVVSPRFSMAPKSPALAQLKFAVSQLNFREETMIRPV